MITRKAWDKDRFRPHDGACPHGAFDGCPHGCFDNGGIMGAQPSDSPMTSNINVRDKLMYDLVQQVKANHEAQMILADLLIKIDRQLNPAREFYPLRVTLTAGQLYIFDVGLKPVSWFVSLDPNSTTGIVSVSASVGGAVWIDLYPGAHVIFPARSQSIQVVNTGAGNALTTFAALGDVPFIYAPS